MTSRPLHVCLDARLIPAVSGGVEQVVSGLMFALSSVASRYRYSFLVYNEFEAHFRALAGPRIELVPVGPVPVPRRLPVWAESARPFLRQLRNRLLPERHRLPAEPLAVERLSPDVIHFNLQIAFRTRRRNIYQPWDLQHRHLPDFFSRAEVDARESLYRAFCRQATLAVVSSEWGKQDLASAYALPSQRIRVVPLASPTDAYPRLSESEVASELAKLGIAQPYGYYPAQSWPHKNHIMLIRSLHLLKQRHGLPVRIVFSGRQTDHYQAIAAEADRLGVGDQIRHVGFVTDRQMVALYRGARLLAFPSLFEGWGLPITEAMALGVPIAATQATCIPEQLGGAGLLFDPSRPEEIADQLSTLWCDQAIREACISRGRSRVEHYTWTRVADSFNDIYAEIAP